MKEYSSCKQAIQSCLESKTFSLAHLYSDEKTMSMHIHDCYEIYFSISGGKQFLIDNQFYDVQPGDVFLINQYESHYLTQVLQELHERIIICIHPDFLKSLSSGTTNLDYCFHCRNTISPHRIRLSEEDQKRFIYLIHRLTGIHGYGSDILEKSVFSEIMVFLNKIFYDHRKTDFDSPDIEISYHGQIDGILTFINQNITNALTIDMLSEHFHLSTSYLCRIFKSATGMTINKYITAKRISLAKACLGNGLSVSETCDKCGFNDYSNFLKAFTKAVGITPGKYSQYNK